MDDIVSELKQALVKEHLMQDGLPTKLSKDFFQRLKQFLVENPDQKEEIEKVRNSLIIIRRPKIIKLSDALPLSEELKERLTTEEIELYVTVNDAAEVYRSKIK